MTRQQFLCVIRRMQAVAIGGFNHQKIRRTRRGWRTHDGIVQPPQVSRKHQSCAMCLERHDRRTKNVARRQQPECEVAAERDRLTERDGRQMLERAQRILFGEQRQRLAVL